MTERFFDCEPLFRELFRLCPPEQKAFRLREWYSSQFTPMSACSQLDLMMTYRQESEVPSEEVALRRLSAFHEYEPQEPTTTAAVAVWHLRNQSRESALAVLQELTDRESARKNKYFQAAYVEALIEAGQMDQATEEFAKWSGPRDGYLYHRISGIFAQEVQGDLTAAAKQLQQAVQAWPGPADWLLMNRLSRCLALKGEREAAQQVQAEAKRVEGLTDLKVHQKIRQALGNLEDPIGLEDVARFYDSFGRTWEAGAWREVIRELQKTAPMTNAFPAPK